MRAVTLDDVAERAGVSGKTVSRVVNHDANVSIATRERVEAAIAETGFRPNLAARSLAAARSYLIGTFTPNASSFYHAELYRGAARACRTLGYHLVLEEFNHRAATVVDRYDKGLREARCDGLILPPPLSDDLRLLDALDRDGVRYVRLAPSRDVARSAAVLAADADGVRALARHLWETGRRRFGVIAGPAEHASTAIRRDVFAATIAAAGGSPDDVTVVDVVWHESMVVSGRNAAAMLLDRAEPPDAVFAFNDEIAAGVIACARDRGLCLPEDLAVAGFDDSEAASLTWPALTTVRQPIAEMGERAVHALVAPRADAPPVIECQVELIVRDSTRRRSTHEGGEKE